ncbi:ABC transporter substrate-binding protein [Microbacterium luticocti]|uniref:ABC transporter substrate-binding protein n=1 Tax=Microbacterium luticocti TaxID=451764 RepID=UPI000411B980|nr:extracellular solute-binding protein [Microbacterium luticocti]
MKTNSSRRPLRRTGVLLTAALTVAALSACSGGGGSSAGGDLTVTYMDSGTYNKAAESIVSDFDKTNDAHVKVEAFPFATLGQQNATDLITGTGAYDVMSTSAWDVEFYNRLAPLNTQLDSWKNKSSYIPELLKDGPTPYYDGKPVGLTYAADAYGVFVNTKYLPADTTFDTWTDLIDAATKLKSTLPDGVAPVSFAFGAADQIPSIFQGAYDGFYITKDGKWGLDDEKAAAALDQTAAIAKLGPANAASLSIDEANELFLGGKAAILIGWPSFVRGPLNDSSRSTLGDGWAQVPFPGPGTPALSSWSLSISSLAKNKDLAWKWIDSYVTPENATKWMFSYGIGSPFKSTYEDPELLKKHANDLPIQSANLSRAIPLPLTLKAFDAFIRPMSQFITSGGSSADAVAAIEAGWSKLELPKALIPTATANGLVEK